MVNQFRLTLDEIAPPKAKHEIFNKENGEEEDWS